MRIPFFGIEITRAKAKAAVQRETRFFGRAEAAASHVIDVVEHDTVTAAKTAVHAAAEAIHTAEAATGRMVGEAKTAMADDIALIKRYVRSTSAKANVSNDALRDIKGGILTTTAQLVSALTAVADQVAKFPAALKTRDDAIAERDARIAQLEAALLTAKAASTDAPDLDSAVATLTAATAAAAAAAATSPKPLSPVAADNVTPVASPPVLTQPVSGTDTVSPVSTTA